MYVCIQEIKVKCLCKKYIKISTKMYLEKQENMYFTFRDARTSRATRNVPDTEAGESTL